MVEKLRRPCVFAPRSIRGSRPHIASVTFGRGAKGYDPETVRHDARLTSWLARWLAPRRNSMNRAIEQPGVFQEFGGRLSFLGQPFQHGPYELQEGVSLCVLELRFYERLFEGEWWDGHAARVLPSTWDSLVMSLFGGKAGPWEREGTDRVRRRPS